MQTRTSIEIHAYWDRIRGAEAGPLRSDIHPGDIRHILPELFILECDGLDDPVFRLAGTRICALFGRELREWNFSSLWNGGHAAVARRAACEAMRDRTPVLLDVKGIDRYGDEIGMEMLLLPIRSAGQRFDRLLGCLAPVSPPRWSLDCALTSLKIERRRPPGKDAVDMAPPPPIRPAAPRGVIEKQVSELMQGIRSLRARHRDPSL